MRRIFEYFLLDLAVLLMVSVASMFVPFGDGRANILMVVAVFMMAIGYEIMVLLYAIISRHFYNYHAFIHTLLFFIFLGLVNYLWYDVLAEDLKRGHLYVWVALASILTLYIYTMTLRRINERHDER
jgi:hypothetical protein